MTLRDRTPPPGAFDYLLKDIDVHGRVPLDDVIRDAQRDVQQRARTEAPPPWSPPPYRRTHIIIEMMAPPARPIPGRRSWVKIALGFFVTMMVLGALAHGQPLTRRDLEREQINNLGGWTAESHQQGFMRYFSAWGPRGEVVRCSSWKEGWQTRTRCDGD